MCNKKRITKRQRAIFLDVLRTTGNISASARAGNLSYKAVHSLKSRDLNFSDEWDIAKNEALDDLEEALRKRAIEGVEKPIYYAGKECGVQRCYSDSLGMYILKTQRGEGNKEVISDNNSEFIREISARELLLEKLEGMANNVSDTAIKE